MADPSISQTKACTKCGSRLPATTEFFYSHAEGRFGLHPECKACFRSRQGDRSRRLTVARQAERAMRALPDGQRKCTCCAQVMALDAFREVRSRGKWVRRATCEQCEAAANKLYLKQKYAANRERVLADNRQWKAANKDKADAATSRWLQANPESRKAITDRYRAKRADAVGTYSAADVKRVLKEQGRQCFYCSAKLTLYHVDHFIPLSRGGTNWPDNIVASCGPCNVEKNAKMPWEWMPERFAEGCTPR
jgi:5-methylcytosine-specific restriction endonuclease McrA